MEEIKLNSELNMCFMQYPLSIFPFLDEKEAKILLSFFAVLAAFALGIIIGFIFYA